MVVACNSLLSNEDLCRFRTKPCRRIKKTGCEFGQERCQYSHDAFWPRRCPFYLSDPSSLRYINVMCPLLKTNSCTRGGACPFTHSEEEFWYHPLQYKTDLCTDFQAGECRRYYCPKVHGFGERRSLRTYNLPFTQGIDVPRMPYVHFTSGTVRSEEVVAGFGQRSKDRRRDEGSSQSLSPEKCTPDDAWSQMRGTLTSFIDPHSTFAPTEKSSDELLVDSLRSLNDQSFGLLPNDYFVPSATKISDESVREGLLEVMVRLQQRAIVDGVAMPLTRLELGRNRALSTLAYEVLGLILAIEKT